MIVGTSRNEQHPFGAVLAIVVDVDRVPYAFLRRMPHLPRSRQRSRGEGPTLNVGAGTKCSVRVFPIVSPCGAARFDAGGNYTLVSTHVYTLKNSVCMVIGERDRGPLNCTMYVHQSTLGTL